MVALYKAQAELVSSILDKPRPVRHLVAADTGAGKTAIAIKTLEGLGARKVLVVSPAIQRIGWRDEFAKWAPDAFPSVGVIDVGRERKLSKKATVVRQAAYEAPVQVVSFDLLGEIAPLGWDAIVVDECHALGSPHSVQSDITRALVAHNPQAHLLFLSATPIPTVPKQLWHPLYLLEGNRWGKPSATGDVSWDFARRYLSITTTEYGKGIGGATDAKKLAALHADLKPVMSRLTIAQIAPEMPPVSVSTLYTKKFDEAFHKDWIKSLEADITHAVIFTHLKETARAVEALAIQLRWPTVYLDGTVPATRRSQALKEAAESKRCLLVATYDSLSVGIRILWAQKVLIGQLSSSPKTVAQVLGRFAAVGSTARPKVQIAVTPKEEDLAKRLVSRAAQIGGILGADAGMDLIQAKFTDDGSRLDAAMSSLFDEFLDQPEGWEDDDE